jgi:hypothetical protein
VVRESIWLQRFAAERQRLVCSASRTGIDGTRARRRCPHSPEPKVPHGRAHTTKAFADYAGYIADRLDDRVKHFFTINEFRHSSKAGTRDSIPRSVTAAIIGPRTAEQLTGSRRSLEISLSDEIIRRLDEIWSGPGGETPHACAW